MKRTMSKSIPQLRRLHGRIIYPVDVRKVSVEEEIDGTTETHYSYFKVELEDRGDDLSDPAVFAKQRYADLRRLAPFPHGYGSKDEQLEMQQEQGFTAWQDHCQQVRDNFPKS